ncbi:HypC/HybG/HupF family hydrogenase formation chaperone [Glycomyces dulcitolivorans]|jgi:hydrogenase expression/formation protein HypC|uniref:HypC/HybG/HupF family hydrogenase formation chaperone n=1 Tax=Glycomyces dulcitolivorans TaxID=2200759 RepID=UPI000DD365CA|nr:HypC/HybG/HupF family hydrogenase formation chaperone [Glycomyces dulcitolivorans]
MCLGVPGRIRSIGDSVPPMGTVDFGGVRREVCLAYTPEAAVGDFVIVHVGFAIARIRPDEAARSLAALRALPGVLEAELGGRP